MSAAWQQVVSFAGIVMWAGWCVSDQSDDGVEVPLHRLAWRQGTAARIDPGVALAAELSR